MRSLERYSEALRISRRLWPHVPVSRKALLVPGGLLLASIATELLRPWPIKWLVDEALTPATTEAVGRYGFAFVAWTGAGAALAIASLTALFTYFATLRVTELGHTVTRGLRLSIFGHLTELPPSFHSSHKSGDLLVRLMGDVPMVSTMLVDSAVALATRALLVLGMIVVMLRVDPVLTAATLAVAPVLGVTIFLLARSLRVAVRKQRRKEGVLADFLHEAIAAVLTIQALGGSGHTVRRFARSNRRSARAGMKVARASARLEGLVGATLGATVALVFLLGAFRVGGGYLSAGELLVFLSYVRSISKPVRALSKHAAKVSKGSACGERLLAVLEEDPKLRTTAGDRSAPESPATLAFEGVSFAYGGDAPALVGLDLELCRGQLTALVGPSGAGKSTLSCLAMRLLDPQEGKVRLDGIDLREFELDSLRDCFSVSLQEAVLLGESVRENLWIGRPDAPDEELEAALEAADALEFVRALPEGLDTRLGSLGSGLSGGQRARLCLARAFLRDAPVLIVDEPFTGLDATASRRVARSLEAYAREHILLVVTHDLRALEDLSRVVFLEDGRLRAQGSHRELLDSNPEYVRLCSQSPDLVA